MIIAIHTVVGYDQARTILGEGTMAGASLILAAPAASTIFICLVTDFDTAKASGFTIKSVSAPEQTINPDCFAIVSDLVDLNDRDDDLFGGRSPGTDTAPSVLFRWNSLDGNPPATLEQSIYIQACTDLLQANSEQCSSIAFSFPPHQCPNRTRDPLGFCQQHIQKKKYIWEDLLPSLHPIVKTSVLAIVIDSILFLEGQKYYAQEASLIQKTDSRFRLDFAAIARIASKFGSLLQFVVHPYDSQLNISTAFRSALGDQFGAQFQVLSALKTEEILGHLAAQLASPESSDLSIVWFTGAGSSMLRSEIDIRLSMLTPAKLVVFSFDDKSCESHGDTLFWPLAPFLRHTVDLEFVPPALSDKQFPGPVLQASFKSKPKHLDEILRAVATLATKEISLPVTATWIDDTHLDLIVAAKSLGHQTTSRSMLALLRRSLTAVQQRLKPIGVIGLLIVPADDHDDHMHKIQAKNGVRTLKTRF